MKLNFYEDGNEVQEQNIPHKLKKLGMGGSQKLPKRILEPLLKIFLPVGPTGGCSGL